MSRVLPLLALAFFGCSAQPSDPFQAMGAAGKAKGIIAYDEEHLLCLRVPIGLLHETEREFWTEKTREQIATGSRARILDKMSHIVYWVHDGLVGTVVACYFAVGEEEFRGIYFELKRDKKASATWAQDWTAHLRGEQDWPPVLVKKKVE